MNKIVNECILKIENELAHTFPAVDRLSIIKSVVHYLWLWCDEADISAKLNQVESKIKLRIDDKTEIPLRKEVDND